MQSFQTGVTLDITPVVNTDNYITVTLHPSVNSEAGVSAAGVPNIQTRDTTTTVGLHDGETLVIGGLIEDEDSESIQKIPILGDIPLLGRLFQDKGITHTRNELIITVTPHIVHPGEAGNYVPADLGMPKPGPLRRHCRPTCSCRRRVTWISARRRRAQNRPHRLPSRHR